jgi:hypothetical protein
VHWLEEVLVVTVIAFDVNETLLDLRALDEPFEALLGSATLRPQWFTLMLQLAFTGGLTASTWTSPPPSEPRWPCSPSARACH